MNEIILEPIKTEFVESGEYSISDSDLRAVANLGTDTSFDSQLREFLRSSVQRVSRQLGRSISQGRRTDYFCDFASRLELSEVPLAGTPLTLNWQPENSGDDSSLSISQARPTNAIDWIYDSSGCSPAIVWNNDNDDYPDLWERAANPVSISYDVAGELTNPTIANIVRSLVFLQYNERAGTEGIESGRIIARVERELRQLREVLV